MIKANYILLDASRMNGMIGRAKELNPNHTCLFEADTARFLDTVAPWLFEFKVGSVFSRWIVEEGRGKSWGILFNSDAEPIDLYKHLRRFLVVKTSNGKEMYFRYYSPQVLSAFLPTCNPQELREFFGPIQSFIAEDANSLLVEYSLLNQEYSRIELKADLTDFDINHPTVSQHTIDQIKPENDLFREESAQNSDHENLSAEIDRKATEQRQGEEETKSGETSGSWDFGY